MPATVSGDLLDYPDELMIEWGNVPVGSTAHIYWPQVNAKDVLSLAKRLYSTHQLSATDANTVQCKVPPGFTFVPIPAGTGENYAGLFTIDLPPSVVTGQEFTIVLRRIATRRGREEPPPPRIGGVGASATATGRGRHMANWRYVVGTFAVRIPVTTGKVMRPLEENTLAIMKWRLAQWSPTDRWYPILLRYVDYISRRVDGLGGNSSAIQPSPLGTYGSQKGGNRGEKCGKQHQHTGKVSGLIFDSFGDFEGFTLDTEEGEHQYLSREKEMEELAERAWRDRLRITVRTRCGEPCRPQSIILHPPPVPFWH